MLAIARAIIAQRSGKFDPSKFRDRYQEALQELIEAKIKGVAIKPRTVAAPAPVIDLMAALKRSLEQRAPTAKGAAAKKRTKAAPDRRQSSARVRRQEKEGRADDRASHTRREATQEGLTTAIGAEGPGAEFWPGDLGTGSFSALDREESCSRVARLHR
jgi:DNA end-binding protein Ku